MTYAFNIPGYVQGFRFSDADLSFYDPVAKRFHDQAGYGPANALDISVGTPAFETVADQRGMILDNTVQGGFLPAIAWEGTAVVVWKPTMPDNGTSYVFVFGSATSIASNGSIFVQRATASDYRHQIRTFGSSATAKVDKATDALVVACLGTSQTTRKAMATEDGVTITESAAVGDNNNGNSLALGYHVSTVPNSRLVRFGNLSGTIGDTSVTTNTVTIFEAHFFSGNPMIDAPDQVQGFLAALSSKYGIA